MLGFRKRAVLVVALAGLMVLSPAGMGNAQQPQSADIKVEVDLVRLSCSATQHGVPVKGLLKDDFIVREDAVPQEVKYFWQESELPLTVGLIVDVSGSQMGFVKKHRETVTQFLKQVLRPDDRAMIVTVGPQARLLVDLTDSQGELAEGIEQIHGGGRAGPILGEPCHGKRATDEDDSRARGRRGRLSQRRRLPCGGTALWNGVYFASRLKMRNASGRKALIVLSDGWDTGSDHGLEDAIEAAQGAETPVYTIKFVGAMNAILFPPIAFKHGMDKLSEETGGEHYGMMHGDLGSVFRQIEEELRNQYVLAYTPENRSHDGRFRKLEVSSRRPGVQVRTRRGYWARDGS